MLLSFDKHKMKNLNHDVTFFNLVTLNIKQLLRMRFE